MGSNDVPNDSQTRLQNDPMADEEQTGIPETKLEARS
jgi:hypothetical protein